MTEVGLFSLFLFLHVISAIIAFGPSFVFPLIGAAGAAEPAHGNFGLRLGAKITDRVVIPVALTMPVTGILLIWFAHLNLLDRTAWWLDIAIVLYIVLVSIGIFVQRPTAMKMVHLTSSPPPAGAPPGPPPGFADLAAQARRNGSVMGLLIVVIVLLMTTRPQF
jgi:hypothetical protein